ncbi:hypothetical protein MRX96_012614 [Rhipicephalus microplus]
MKIENLLIRQLINEFLGTMILITIGDSIMAIIIAGDNESLAACVGPLGWGVAIYVAVQISGGVSSHLNPAVTLAQASVRKFPIAKVPLYFAAQYLGGFVGAALVPHVSTLTCFIDQVIATGIMMVCVEAIGDTRNFGGIPPHIHPICLGLMIMAIIFSFAYNCMCPLNPARDISPRLFTLMAGWGPETFTLRGWNYVWVPLLGPHIGAILGVWLYKVAIGDHWPEKPKPAISTDGKETKEDLVETLYKVDGDKMVLELEPTQHQRL